MINLSEVDSTNNYLKSELSNTKPLPEGTVIMADHQFAGRGQHGNVWTSERGKNLMISILFRPDFLKLSEQFYLNKAISLGINDCLTTIIGEACKIKWPNDVFYKDKKLGGVLIENTSIGAYLKTSVVGIGINVNQQNFGDTVDRATCLAKILHQDYEREILLKQLCNAVENRYLQLKEGEFTLLDVDYESKLYRLNESHDYLVGDSKLNGVIKGVSKEGYLLLNTGELQQAFDLKQVKFVFDED